MKNRIPLMLAAIGLLAAWYWNRQQSIALAALAASVPQAPVLPSTQIGEGYIGPIAPLVVDRVNGDVTVPFGTDLILDPSDPAWEYMGASIGGLPNVTPQGM